MKAAQVRKGNCYDVQHENGSETKLQVLEATADGSFTVRFTSGDTAEMTALQIARMAIRPAEHIHHPEPVTP